LTDEGERSLETLVNEGDRFFHHKLW
jgi:hypothetical protein